MDKTCEPQLWVPAGRYLRSSGLSPPDVEALYYEGGVGPSVFSFPCLQSLGADWVEEGSPHALSHVCQEFSLFSLELEDMRNADRLSVPVKYVTLGWELREEGALSFWPQPTWLPGGKSLSNWVGGGAVG